MRFDIQAGLELAFALLLLSPVAPPPASAAEAKAAAAQPPDASAPAAEAELEEPDPDPWPRLIEGDAYALRVFPPQVDSWEGSQLSAHVAVELLEKGKEAPVYGVVDFGARTRVDKESRLVVIDEFVALGAKLPSAPDREARLLGFVQQKLNDAMRVISLDRLEAALAASESERSAPELVVSNQPPQLVFAEKPTMLLLVDGEPVWKKIGDTTFERLVNTRPLVVREDAGKIRLHLFNGWLTAETLAGPWKVSLKPSKEFEAAVAATLKAQSADLLDGGEAQEVDSTGRPIEKPSLYGDPIPEVVVATTPTELVIFEGPAKWTGIPGTALEFVENTTGNVFRSGASSYSVLVSGRWFGAASLAGPWRHVAQKELSPEFAKIPDDSPKENVKASVAGTPQAKEAAIANSIPQTAEVKRAEAKFTATIDGAPKLAKIEGTSLSYVENSPTPILKVAENEWYAVANGVWFTGKAHGGPWSVAESVPKEIYAIPPSSPIHYVTYVRIYGGDDETVVVGYTPGYYGTVASDGVVVCGSGYSYDPWIGSTWYGHPATYGYGCGMTYTPWDGWAFTYGVGWAWGYWGSWYGPYYPPYWGGYWGYYPYYGGAVVGPGGGWAAWGPGGWAGTTGNIYRSWGNASSVSRYSGGFNAWTGNAWRGQVGAAYNSRTGTIAAGQRGAVQNVYNGAYAYGGRGVAKSGRTGNVYGGGRATVGGPGGNEITGGRAGAYDPSTGQGGSAGWVHGDSGGVARVGDDYYAGKDGDVYRRGDDGSWSQVDRSGNWNDVNDRSRTGTLDRQYEGRSSGSQRYSGHRMSTPRAGGARGGGGRRR